MATTTSSLIVRLLDQVSGPAKQAAASIRGIGAAARGAGNIGFGTQMAAQARENARAVAALQTRMVAFAGAAYGVKRALQGVVSPAAAWQSTMLDIAQKADLSDAAMEGLGGRIRTLARTIGKAPSEAAKAVDFLMGMGLDPDRALAIMPAIGKTAVAYKATIEDLSKAGYASLDNLKVPAGEFSRALDAMAQAGKEGAFELKDMAQYFPSLTQSAAALGMTGVSGVAKISAALQIARKGAGDASSAATNTTNLMTKIISPETTKKFKKLGVDIRAELKKTQDKGGDVFEMIGRVTQKALKGNVGKLGDLFEDMQVQQFLRPLIANMAEYVRIRDAALNARGVVEADFARRGKTFEQTVERLKGAAEDWGITIGNKVLPYLTNLVTGITNVGNNLDKSVNVFDRIKFAIDGFINGLQIDGVTTFTSAMERLKTAIFGDAATFEADLKSLSATFQSFRAMGQSLREFAASVGEAVASIERLAGLDAGTIGSTLGSIAKYGVLLAAASVGFVALAGSLRAVGSAIMFLSGMKAALSVIRTLRALSAAAPAATAARRPAGAGGVAAGAGAGWLARAGRVAGGIGKRFLGPLGWGLTAVEGYQGVTAAREKWDANNTQHGFMSAPQGAQEGQEKLAAYRAELDEIITRLDSMRAKSRDSASFDIINAAAISRAQELQNAITQLETDLKGLDGVSVAPKVDQTSIQAAMQAVQGLKNAISSLGSVSAPKAATPAVDGARARGGDVRAGGSYLVGERGPEIFNARRSGRITANDKIGSGGGGVSVRAPVHLTVHGGGNVDADDLADKIGRKIADAAERSLRGRFADTGFA